VRFILAALVLLGLASYLANPALFGQKKKFSLSGNGQIKLEQRGAKGVDIDWEAVGNRFADLVLPGESPIAAAPLDEAAVVNMALIAPAPAAAEPETAPPPVAPPVEPVVMPANAGRDLGSYEGRLAAISEAIRQNPTETDALMKSATQSCVETAMPDVLSTYFVRLVSLVAVASQLPKNEQRAYFSAQNEELGATIKLWLFSQPAEARAAAQTIMQGWAAAPDALVACHLVWLENG